ncbi:MAG: PorV/PorQ family protein [Ignavibacteria bacterium]|nr:PorV/PorQ family protein [Ignavibacteria bacterium]
MKTLSSVLAFLLVLPAYGQEFKKTATSGFVFLEIPVTARTAALGEASLSLSDVNAEGVFANPASVGFTTQTHSASFSYAPWIAEMKHYASSYAYDSPLGVFAVGVIVFDFGSMPRTQRASGRQVYEVVGDFNANGLCVGLTYSKRLTDRFSFGVTTKYVREGIDIYRASNVLFDGGVLYYTGFQSLRIAAALQNFGTDAKYKNDPFKMPSMLRLGMAAELLGDFSSQYRVSGLVEALHPSDADERVNVGLEVAWNSVLMVRGGYKFRYDEETYSVGVGLRPSLAVPVGLDVAFSDYGRLGNILRFSLQMGLQ